MRAFIVALFAVFMVLSVNGEAKQPKTAKGPNAAPNPGVKLVNSGLTAKEKQAIEEQKEILDEMMELFAKHALDRPADFTACVREMFAMRRNKKCRDKFTRYLAPKDYKRSDDDLAGQFGGVGLELMQEDNMVIVTGSIKGTPASRAGIEVRDIILKVDGKEVADLEEAVSLIRGKPGTDVTLTVFRGKARKELNFTLTREIINIELVKWRMFGADKQIGIVKVLEFGEGVPIKFAGAIADLMKKGAKSIVIDLRDNPGGYVESVLPMLAFFAEGGDVLISMRRRQSKEEINTGNLPLNVFMSYMLGAGIIRKELKGASIGSIGIVVLINKGSASASEIFSGTMKDWGYQIVGEKSYGKGVGQELFKLSDGSVLALTTFEFLVGNKKVAIRDKGVKPTFEVKAPEKKNGEDKKNEADKNEKDDPQLMKAIEILQSCAKKDPAYKCTR